MKPVYKYPAIAACALALFLFSLFVLFSSELVEKIVKVELEENSGISFIAKDFTKGFPLGFNARDVRLSAKGINGNTNPLEIIRIEDISVSLDILPLIIGKKKFSYLATLESGTIEGEAQVAQNSQISVRANGVPLNRVQPLRALGIKSGRVNGVASFTSSPEGCAVGTVVLDASDIDIKGLKSPFPVMLFGESVSASLAMETAADCVARIDGLFIEGHALNAKLDGTIRIKSPVERSVLDMRIEIFIKPGALGKDANNILLSIMNEYKKSPGHYLMTLKGTLRKPYIK